MKIEFVLNTTAQEHAEAEYTFIIPCSEFLDSYNRNKDYCFKELNYVVYMYCIANGLNRELSDYGLQKVVEHCEAGCDIAISVKKDENQNLRLDFGRFEK